MDYSWVFQSNDFLGEWLHCFQDLHRPISNTWHQQDVWRDSLTKHLCFDQEKPFVWWWPLVVDMFNFHYQLKFEVGCCVKFHQQVVGQGTNSSVKTETLISTRLFFFCKQEINRWQSTSIHNTTWDSAVSTPSMLS